MYEELYQLLVPGFLSFGVRIDGHTYCLRSLGLGDLYLIAGVAKEHNPEWRLRAVASSLWMVDGISLLENTPQSSIVAFEFLRRSHKRVISTLFNVVLGFFLRGKKASNYLESFLYEEESRRLWHSLNRGHFSLVDRAGIPGVDRLGQNPTQAAWVAWNTLEDTREEQEYLWSQTKVLVSIQSGKAAQKLDSRDKNRHDSETRRRSDVQTKAYQIFCGQLGPEGKNLTTSTGLVVRSTQTNEDLVEEMRNWVTGNQDDHDRIVEEYKERIRREYLAREEAKAQVLEESKKRREDAARNLGSTKTRLTAFTPKQLSEKFPQAGKPGTRFIVEADPVSKLFNRYLRDVPEAAPGLSVEGDRLMVDTPARVDPPTPLNDLIATRKSLLNG